MILMRFWWFIMSMVSSQTLNFVLDLKFSHDLMSTLYVLFWILTRFMFSDAVAHHLLDWINFGNFEHRVSCIWIFLKSYKFLNEMKFWFSCQLCNAMLPAWKHWDLNLWGSAKKLHLRLCKSYCRKARFVYIFIAYKNYNS